MSISQRTLVLVKPDGVQRHLAGRVITRFEERGLKIVALKITPVSAKLAETHYAVHAQRPFFKGLVEFISSGPVVAMVLEGPNAIAVVRSMVGATKPHESAPGTIRGDFALETAKNLIHASDAPETAAAEIALWFPEGGLVEYTRATDAWILSDEE
ncbi:MAG: nucleoside-diphosphate kinase [Chloroflexi bacterium]|jgi:nucleoside-diphosphate kinase|nr:nucleoside-diphosphate kinase [Chloroflexota bacterium]